MLYKAQILEQLEQHKVALFGLGITGMSMLRFLLSQNISPDVFDTQQAPSENAQKHELLGQVASFFGPITDDQFEQYDYVLISPGISLRHPAIVQAKANGVQVFCDIELFAQVNTKPVLAVTGSNGKSTVVAWLTDFLNRVGKKAVVCGNFGVPVLDVINEDVDAFVIELSSFQLDTTESLVCEAGCVLNVSPDHLDRYDSFADYAKSKRKIYQNAKTAIFNGDDELTIPRVSKASNDVDTDLAAPHVAFGIGSEVTPGLLWRYDPKNQFLYYGNNVIADFSTFALSGHHNALNALAVMALANTIGVYVKNDIAHLAEFSGLTHRCQHVRTLNNVAFVDDSKATNIASCQAAIGGLATKKNIILIAGGDAKGAELSELNEVIENHVKAVVALGKDKHQFVNFVASEKLHLVTSMKDAVDVANSLAVSQDIVLLSPACASIDMFRNYQARAAAFIDAVTQLGDQS